MGGDVVLDQTPLNPCCAELKKKCATLENSRNNLRQAVKIWENEFNKLTAERDYFKKAYEDERVQAQSEKEAREKDSNVRHDLEKQIHELRVEISSYGKIEGPKGMDELQAKIFKGETEIKRLEDLAKKERKIAESEKQKADSESRRAAEAWRLLKTEKSKVEEERNKAEEARRVLEVEKEKAEEYKLGLEKFQKEAIEVREKLIIDMNKKIKEENHKALRKCADLWRRKVEEQKRLVEVERKNLMNKDAYINQLSEQLEAEKKRSKELEKKINEVVSADTGNHVCSPSEGRKISNDTDLEHAHTRLLRQQLKLKKKEAKYFKRAAQLDKAESSFMKQQLQLLIQDFVQISSHLNLLDGHLSHSGEGTQSKEKIAGSLKLHQNSSGFRSCNSNSQNMFGLLNSCQMCSQNDSGSRREDTGFLLHRGSCMRPTSGITSELEPPIGDSFRKKPQSSAVCSTTTSFSDKKFMGSQGGDAFNVSKSAKVNYSNGSVEVAETMDAKNKIGGEKSDRRYARKLLASIYDEKEVSDSSADPRRKKRKMIDILEFFAWLYCEGKELHNKISQKLPVGEGVFKGKESSHAEVCSQGHGIPMSSNENDHFRKSSKPDRNLEKQIFDNEPSTQSHDQRLMDKIGRKVCKASGFPMETSTHVSQTKKSFNENRAQPINASTSNRTELFCLEDMTCGDYMKLLDLDSDTDERRYRKAVERPLSPTLPEIHLNTLQLYGDNSHYLVEELFRPETEGLDSASSHHSDVVGLEIESNVSKLQSFVVRKLPLDENRTSRLPSEKAVRSSTPGKVFRQQEASDKFVVHSSDSLLLNKDILSDNVENDLLQNISCVTSGPDQMLENIEVVNVGLSQAENECICKSSDNIATDQLAMHQPVANLPDRSLPCTRNSAQTKTNQVSEYSAEKQAAENLSSDVGLAQAGIDRTGIGRDGIFLVVFSNIKDEESISRIFHARNAIINKTCMDAAVDCSVRQVLKALAVEPNLLPQEKVSVFFSLLLCMICGAVSTHVIDLGFSTSLNSFSTELIKGISDEKGNWLTQEGCQSNILLSLIQDFLIAQKVLKYDRLHQPLSNACIKFQFPDGGCLSSKPATHNQLVAGGIILAYICASFDQIPVLLETSYKILRLCRCDTSWILTVLHVFALICGHKYFVLDDYSYLTSAICLVVSLLERGEASTFSTSLCILAEEDAAPRFSPCDHCPFSANSVCEDKFISLLLDVLHGHALAGIRYSSADEPVMSSVHAVAKNAGTYEKSTGEISKTDGLNSVCNTSCFLLEHGKHVADPAGVAGKRGLCYFTDIISLLELVTYYKSWEWTCNEVVPRLLSITKLCTSEDFAAALYVLIGQLGRFGIEECGYQHSGVVELRCYLGLILDTSVGRTMSLPAQFAVAGALLNLLSVSYADIIEHDVDLTLHTDQSDQIEVIKKWFSHLSQGQQSLSMALFRQGGLQNI